MKKIKVLLPAISFAIGWIVGRGTAVGFQQGEVMIGGIVVAIMYGVVLLMIKQNEE